MRLRLPLLGQGLPRRGPVSADSPLATDSGPARPRRLFRLGLPCSTGSTSKMPNLTVRLSAGMRPRLPLPGEGLPRRGPVSADTPLATDSGLPGLAGSSGSGCSAVQDAAQVSLSTPHCVSACRDAAEIAAAGAGLAQKEPRVSRHPAGDRLWPARPCGLVRPRRGGVCTGADRGSAPA